jgi:hypothetical protein
MSVQTPVTSIRTSHAASIIAGGKTVGQIQSWAPNQTLQVTHAYELNQLTSGTVTENVPGNISGLTIQVGRYDLFAAKMESVWGLGYTLKMLTDQRNPFTVREKWVNPDNSTETYEYFDCWFSSLGRNLQASGDRIVMVNATITYSRFKPL